MRLLSKKDIVLIVAILLIALSFLNIQRWLHSRSSHGNIYAEIIFRHAQHSEIVYLGTDKVFYLPYVPNVLFEVRNGQISFIESDCPDQICVQAGFQGRPGQMTACLPNGLILSVLSYGFSDDGIDIFVH